MPRRSATALSWGCFNPRTLHQLNQFSRSRIRELRVIDVMVEFDHFRPRGAFANRRVECGAGLAVVERFAVRFDRCFWNENGLLAR
jgi:hypothetical protein